MSGEIKQEVRAAKVFFGEDRILRVEIDLNHAPDVAVEARVGAYGTLEYAREIATKWFMICEMRAAQEAAVKRPGIIAPTVH